jgi:hypothetical protein
MVATRDLKSLVFTDVRVRVPSLVLKTSFAMSRRGFFNGAEQAVRVPQAVLGIYASQVYSNPLTLLGAQYNGLPTLGD